STKPEKFPASSARRPPLQWLPRLSTRENPDRWPPVRKIRAKIHGHSRDNIPRHFRHPEKYKSSAAARFAPVRPGIAVAHADPPPQLLNPCGYTQIQSSPTNGDRETTP